MWLERPEVSHTVLSDQSLENKVRPDAVACCSQLILQLLVNVPWSDCRVGRGLHGASSSHSSQQPNKHWCYFSKLLQWTTSHSLLMVLGSACEKPLMDEQGQVFVFWFSALTLSSPTYISHHDLEVWLNLFPAFFFPMWILVTLTLACFTLCVFSFMLEMITNLFTESKASSLLSPFSHLFLNCSFRVFQKSLLMKALYTEI